MVRLGPFCPVFAAVLAVWALTACSRQNAAPGTDYQKVLADPGPPVPGDWVITRMDSDPDTLNPLTCQTANGMWLANSVITEACCG